MAPIDRFKWDIHNLQNGFSDFESVLPLPQDQKAFASYEQQINKLRSKGAQIGGHTEDCQRKLCEVTYYRMKGYLQKPKGGYIPFKNACRLDEFDTRMRSLLFYSLSRIEICIRCQFSYFYTERKGPYGYLNRDNHASDQSYVRFLNIVQGRVEENASAPFVKHYLEHYHGIMPFWTLSELLTFGHWVELYEDWTLEDKKSLIDQYYGVTTKLYQDGSKKAQIARSVTKIRKAKKTAKTADQDEWAKTKSNPKFLSWLLSCRNLRNVCAHCGRLSYRTFPWETNLPDEYRHSVMKGEKKDEKKLWEKILAVQFLYPDPDEWVDIIVPQMKTLLSIAYRKGNRLDENALRAALGFPPDWEKKLEIWRNL